MFPLGSNGLSPRHFSYFLIPLSFFSYPQVLSVYCSYCRCSGPQSVGSASLTSASAPSGPKTWCASGRLSGLPPASPPCTWRASVEWPRSFRCSLACRYVRIESMAPFVANKLAIKTIISNMAVTLKIGLMIYHRQQNKWYRYRLAKGKIECSFEMGK